MVICLISLFRPNGLICCVDDRQKNLNEDEIHKKYEDNIIDRAKYSTSSDNVGERAVGKQYSEQSGSEMITEKHDVAKVLLLVCFRCDRRIICLCHVFLFHRQTKK
jgi:hypothetical protein